jgi:hypothetical protein
MRAKLLDHNTYNLITSHNKKVRIISVIITFA